MAAIIRELSFRWNAKHLLNSKYNEWNRKARSLCISIYWHGVLLLLLLMMMKTIYSIRSHIFFKKTFSQCDCFIKRATVQILWTRFERIRFVVFIIIRGDRLWVCIFVDVRYFQVFICVYLKMLLLFFIGISRGSMFTALIHITASHCTMMNYIFFSTALLFQWNFAFKYYFFFFSF